MKLKILNIILIVLLTALNMFRYNLPVYLNTISLFDTLSLVSLGLAILIAIINRINLLGKTLLIFNLIGVLDSIVDEIFYDATHRSPNDTKMLIGSILFCLGYMLYHMIFRKKPLL